jgi:septal ring factor EnvC (AmiA/AmiB activator)
MSTEHTLTQLKQQQVKLNAKIKQIEARLKKAAQQQEIRRQILVGAYVLKKARDNQTLEALLSEMQHTLKSKRDRALFGLQEENQVPLVSSIAETD